MWVLTRVALYTAVEVQQLRWHQVGGYFTEGSIDDSRLAFGIGTALWTKAPKKDKNGVLPWHKSEEKANRVVPVNTKDKEESMATNRGQSQPLDEQGGWESRGSKHTAVQQQQQKDSALRMIAKKRGQGKGGKRWNDEQRGMYPG